MAQSKHASPSGKKYKTLIVWMRRDLRVADNAALSAACMQAEQVVPFFVLDKEILSRPDTGQARVLFLRDALNVLHHNLHVRGGRLIVRQGKALEQVLKAVEEFEANGVFFHREYEPYGRQRDDAVLKALKEAGKVGETFKDIVLFEGDEILTQTHSPYTVFTPYKKIWFGKPADPPYPIPAQVSVPRSAHGLTLPLEDDALHPETEQVFECGGENAAQALLKDFVHGGLEEYGTQRDILASDGTSRLSRHLHLGTICVRTVVDAVRHAEHHSRSHARSEGAMTFLSELAWHDFYMQILYHFPHVADGAFKPVYDKIAWENDETLFRAWREGKTGYPIVDAAMRQLNTEAWMHNRGRMIVASFLTKDLLIDWRWGERYFMEKLVDGDQAANNGGWQWAAGTGTDAQPYFRIFNPTTQGEKFDPEGDYVRRWVPELARVPAAVIHQPWKLSDTERQHLGCDSYPMPVVDHAAQRVRALEMYRQAAKE